MEANARFLPKVKCNFYRNQIRDSSQGKDFGELKGIWSVFGEILPLQKSKEKLRATKEK